MTGRILAIQMEKCPESADCGAFIGGAEAILMKFMKFMRNGRECRCHKDFGRFLMRRCFSALMATESLARLASLARNRVGFSRRGVSSDSSRAAIFLIGG
jgi:hypothetical protein